MRILIMHAFIAVLAALSSAQAKTASDSTKTALPWHLGPVYQGAFDEVTRGLYLQRHSYSLDHFLESEPGLLLTRSGPIGKQVAFSRYGIGRGRGVVYLNGIPINDPQNDMAPVTQFATSGLGILQIDGDRGNLVLQRESIEGFLRIEEQPPLTDKPRTFIELSKGDKNLRQRRIRFSSGASKVGLDIAYDELLNDGYDFDARGILGGLDYGKSSTRQTSFALRGQLPEGEDYSVSFRRFTSVSAGDLSSVNNEERLKGYLGVAGVALRGGAHVAVFQRGYAATFPDSVTSNTTLAVQARWSFEPTRGTTGRLGVAFEDIVATQDVGGSSDRSKLRKTTVGARFARELPVGLSGSASFTGVDYHGLFSDWGASAGVARQMGRNARAIVRFRRGLGMPNLGELFLPAHMSGGVMVGGNGGIKAESSWEASGQLIARWGALTNELMVAGIRAVDPITFAESTVGAQQWSRPVNGAEEDLTVVSNRLVAHKSFRLVETRFDGGVTHTRGDRNHYFAATPRTRAGASLRAGNNLFEETSALYFGAEYVYNTERKDYDGRSLPSYTVWNFRLDGRLLDAQMYLMMLNVFDQQYQTQRGFLMTPRTFVYGITWELFQ